MYEANRQDVRDEENPALNLLLHISLLEGYRQKRAECQVIILSCWTMIGRTHQKIGNNEWDLVQIDDHIATERKQAHYGYVSIENGPVGFDRQSRFPCNMTGLV